jgi:putative two-component system response regulator
MRGACVSGGRVLVVDDDHRITMFLDRILREAGYEVAIAYDGESALCAVAETPPDLIIIDVVMPGRDGFAVCQHLKNDPATRLTPVILVSGLHEPDVRVRGLEVGADDFLHKPFDTRELLVRSRVLVRRKRYTDDLDSAASIITTLSVMIDARDGYLEGHCHRMANYASALGRAIGLSEGDVLALHRGGFLHDIGMLAISDALLRRPGSLDPEEYALVQSHTVIGDSLCGNLRSLQAVRPIVRHHHERLDGSGYPDGLSGDGIPLIAQIMGIVDVYDAVTTQRPYQRTQSTPEALDVLGEQVRRGWRRGDLVTEFARLVDRGALDRFSTDRARTSRGYRSVGRQVTAAPH